MLLRSGGLKYRHQFRHMCTYHCDFLPPQTQGKQQALSFHRALEVEPLAQACTSVLNKAEEWNPLSKGSGLKVLRQVSKTCNTALLIQGYTLQLNGEDPLKIPVGSFPQNTRLSHLKILVTGGGCCWSVLQLYAVSNHAPHV